ncbi:MAG: tetratricopeptide repeat protein, partial [Ktedonobacteraceae bacterium]
MAPAPHPARIFVGRQHEEQLYQQLLTGDDFWVLLFTGMGGIGKTTLLEHLAQVTPPGTRVAWLNLASETLRSDPLKILDALASQLAHACSPEVFVHFQQELQMARRELAALQLPQAQIQMIRSKEHNDLRDISFSMAGADAAFLQEKRRHLYELVTAVLYDLLATLSSSRLVIMLDTCERLLDAENSVLANWLLNDLLAELHERLQWRATSCSLVLASRFSLPFERVNQQDIRSAPLRVLAEIDCDDYFSRCGMADTALRKRIYQLTRGHALCISLIATIWREQSARPLTVADVPLLQGAFNESVLLKFVYERILDKRLLSPYRELTRYGVLLRRFHLPLLRVVFPELLPDAQATEIFNHLRNYPHIEPRDSSTYVFHDLLREILAPEIRVQEPEKWQLYHQRAMAYYEVAAPASPEYYYHALACDEEQAIDEWWDAVEEARFQRDRNRAVLLLDAAHDQALDLHPSSGAARAFQQAWFHIWNYQMDEAMLQCEDALNLYRQVGSKQGEANVLQARGDVQQFRDEREAALESYEQALGLFRQVGDRLGEANCYLAQGNMALEQEQYENALELYNRAYALYQHIQASYSQARLLYFRSYAHEAMDELQRAIQDMETSLAIAQKLHLPQAELFLERLQELRDR